MIQLSEATTAFRGGLALAPNKQGLDKPIIVAPLAPMLVFKVTDALVVKGDCVLAGQPIATNTLASTSGVIDSVESKDSYQVIKLKPDGNHTLSAMIAKAPDDLSAIKASGLQGLGGAGFSTIKKLNSQTNTRLNTLVINAAECEPMIACDEALMLEHATDIIAGVNTLRAITDCQQCIVAIEDSKPDAIARMQDAINAAESRSSIQLKVIPTRYPGGAETTLLKQLTGHPITKGQRPSDYGLLCFNVATALSAYWATQRQPYFGRVVTLAGNAVAQPCNIQALYGTPIKHLLKHAGNISTSNVTIKIGGPLSGETVDSQDNTTAVTARSNAVIIEHNVKPSKEAPCIRCGDCADACPESLLPQQLLRYQDDLEQLSKHQLVNCIECHCCDLVCPSHIPLTNYFKQSKQSVAKQNKLQADALLAEKRFEAREQRLARRAIEREQEIIAKKQLAATAPGALDIKAALARAKNSDKPS